MTQELGPNQRKWIEALRSGEFRQGQFALSEFEGRKEHNCCLGVACRLFGQKRGRLRRKSRKRFGFVDGSRRPTNGSAPRRIARLLGIRNEQGLFVTVRNSLTGLNDEGKTFAEIADFCEANPEAVFTEAR